MVQFSAAVLAAFVGAAALSAQTPTTTLTVTGCVQRAPTSMGSHRFMLMNASVSPMGGAAATNDTAPQPPRTQEPIEHQPGESDTRQETGGVMYLLDGGTDVDSKVGQRVEVDGMLGPRVAAPPTRLSIARPVLQIRVSHMRAVAPHC